MPESIYGVSANKKIQEDTPIYSYKNILLNGEGQDITKDISIQSLGNSTTVIASISSDNLRSLQAIFGISNASPNHRNSYFSIFTRDTGELGIEVRDMKDNINYLISRPAALWGKNQNSLAINKIAIVADEKESAYRVYANGEEIIDYKVSNFKPLSEIEGINNFMIGGVMREGKIDYGYEGNIESLDIYNSALSSNELKQKTSNDDLNKMVFNSEDATNSNYFRIPTLYTLNSGRIISSADARYGGTHDSPNKINIATSYSDDDGKNWSSPQLALQWSDYENQKITWPRDNIEKNLQIKGSASFIDSALLQDPASKRTFLMADFMPAGVGNSNSLKNDSGYKKIDGKYFLKLRKSDETEYNYTIRDNGIIYDDKNNLATDYKVDKNYNLLYQNRNVMGEQYNVKFDSNKLIEQHNGKQIKMNIFYKDAPFKVTPTNYIGMTTSDDEGESWSSPVLLPPFLGVDHNGGYLCPGQGIALSNGRLMFASYSNNEMSYIISDDHGKTWSDIKAKLPFNNATAESQMVEIKPGVIQTYMRTTTGKIGYMTSYDNGETWSDVNYLDIVNNTSYGTQLSIIKYSQLVDGQHVLIMSTPNSTNGRRNGQIWMGLINENEGTVNWKKEYDVDQPMIGYSYSAITELSNHKIGLLYEKFDSWSRNELHLKDVLKWTTINVEDINSSN